VFAIHFACCAIASVSTLVFGWLYWPAPSEAGVGGTVASGDFDASQCSDLPENFKHYSTMSGQQVRIPFACEFRHGILIPGGPA
jgi:hypothetical protein